MISGLSGADFSESIFTQIWLLYPMVAAGSSWSQPHVINAILWSAAFCYILGVLVNIPAIRLDRARRREPVG